MHTPATGRAIRFGPFQVDPRTRELRKGRSRIRVADQSIRILLALLDRAGDVVTREELAAILWPHDTGVDVEHGLNSAVRRLRDSIGDSVDRPVFIETVPRIGYRFIGVVEPPGSSVAASAPVGETPRAAIAPAAQPPPDRLRSESRRRRWLVGTAIALLAATLSIVTWRGTRSRDTAAVSLPTPIKLTFEGGLQTDPSFSPDGQWIAYTSDSTGNFEINIRRLSGGDPIPIAHDPASDSQPDWSPDGNRLVFRSERAGGGLFVVPATGGAVAQISKVGFRPRWSPDGRLILFAGTIPTGLDLSLQVIDAGGGTPRRAPGGASGAFGWQPRSSTVLMFNSRAGPFEPMLRSWDVGAPSSTAWTVADNVTREFRAQRLAVVSGEEVMASPDMSSLYFVGLSRGARAVWRIDVDAPVRHIVSGPHRITRVIDANSASLSPDGRRVVFDGSAQNAQILSYPLDSMDGRDANPDTLTSDAIHAEEPTLSRDGRAFAFVLNRPGSPERSELVARLPGESRERTIRVIEHPREVLGLSRWNHDGTKLVFGVVSNADEPAPLQQLRLFDASTGDDKPLTSLHGVATIEFPTGWTPDGRHVVAVSSMYVEGQSAIALLPVDRAPAAERARQVITSSAEVGIAVAAMSPDTRWIAFRAAAVDGRAPRIAVVPASGGDRSKWTFVTPGIVPADKPAWSEDGAILYFLSGDGGAMNVWGAHFDAVRGTTAGEPFKVTKFDGPGAHILSDIRVVELAVGGRRLLVPVVRPKGGLWTLEQPTR